METPAEMPGFFVVENCGCRGIVVSMDEAAIRLLP